jgi:hypothetical protein
MNSPQPFEKSKYLSKCAFSTQAAKYLGMYICICHAMYPLSRHSALDTDALRRMWAARSAAKHWTSLRFQLNS